jgi:TolB-like protein/DNA-binding winged helix-turn-helix (wHTH) protein
LSFRFTDFEIDVARQELRRAGAIVHIEPQVFDLLVHLIRNRDRIVGKDELIDTVWQGRIVSEATLSSRISAARRALGDSGNDQSFIRTLYKRGFRFVGEVDDTLVEPAVVSVDKVPPEVVSDAVNLVPAGEPIPLEPTIAAPARRTRLAVAAIGLVLSLLIAGWWLLTWGSPSLTASTSNQIALASSAESSPDRLKASLPSIVVLPFANLSGDASQDYFADGISDSLISDLVRALPGMPVVSRDTAFTYKGRSADARQIRRELGVRYLLEGSVVPEGSRVRVNARLVETKEGSQLWSERFDAERKSILDVQDEIVGRVSRAIGLKVIAVEAQRSWRERPGSAEAIDLIMLGKAVLNLPSSAATMIEARGLFDQALKVQPDNVDGLAGAAATLVFEFLNGYYETGGDERLRRAESLLDRAVMIEPRHLVALKAKAALHRTQGKFDDAIAAAQAVIMENPGEHGPTRK